MNISHTRVSSGEGTLKRLLKSTRPASRNIVCALLLLMIYPADQLHAKTTGHLSKKIAPLIGKNDAIHVIDPEGRIVISKNARERRVPASTLKIVTSLAALHLLGPDYRFVTDIFIGRDDQISLKGYGDPLLISETLEELALRVAGRLENKAVNGIRLDDTYFGEDIRIPGRSRSTNPYDAPNGALSANFNTVFFETGKAGKLKSAESQTPLIPFAVDKIRQRIRLTGKRSGRVVFSHQKNENTFYTGHLFRYFLQKQGISVKNKIVTAPVSVTDDQLLLQYRSPFPLTEVIAGLLQYSNNFTANQILIAMGGHKFGAPATLEKGVLAVNNYLKSEMGLSRVQVIEGSGISRKNQITAEDLCRILEGFSPYHHLMPQKGREFYKTGSLYGVRARAGYIKRNDGKLYRFAVLLNTPGKRTKSIMRVLLSTLD